MSPRPVQDHLRRVRELHARDRKRKRERLKVAKRLTKRKPGR